MSINLVDTSYKQVIVFAVMYCVCETSICI